MTDEQTKQVTDPYTVYSRAFALASLTVSASKVTLTVLHGQAMYNLEAWNRFLAAFEAAHPDIEIDLIAPPCGEAQDKIVTMTATGVPLDVVFNNCVSDYPTLAFQSAFVDLTSLVTRDEAELNTRDLVPGTLDAVRQLRAHIRHYVYVVTSFRCGV